MVLEVGVHACQHCLMHVFENLIDSNTTILKPLTRLTMVLFNISLETLAIWEYGSINSYLIVLILADCPVELARTVQF